MLVHVQTVACITKNSECVVYCDHNSLLMYIMLGTVPSIGFYCVL